MIEASKLEGFAWRHRLRERSAKFPIRRLLADVENLMRERGIEETRDVPPKVWEPLLETAALEDREFMLQAWTELLVAALNAASVAIDRRFVSVLSELETAEVEALAVLFAEWQRVQMEQPHKYANIQYAPGIDAPHGSGQLVADNLFRLGLIAATDTTFQVASQGVATYGGSIDLAGEDVSVAGSQDVVRLTSFGEAFCIAIGLGGAIKSY